MGLMNVKMVVMHEMVDGHGKQRPNPIITGTVDGGKCGGCS